MKFTNYIFIGRQNTGNVGYTRVANDTPVAGVPYLTMVETALLYVPRLPSQYLQVSLYIDDSIFTTTSVTYLGKIAILAWWLQTSEQYEDAVALLNIYDNLTPEEIVALIL